MKTLKLHYPVHTLNGKEIFAAGSVLTHETIQEARKKYPPPPTTTQSLLKHGSVLNDLQDMIGQPPYSTVYSNKEDRSAVLTLMERSQVQPIVLDSLDYFHRYDINTYRHALMVFALSLLLTRHLTMPRRDLVQEILSAGPTHDIGKTCVPIAILSKSTPLTVNERRHLEHHTAAGFALLAWDNDDARAPAPQIARNHHERSNGTGYPEGKRLNNILVEVIAACDIYDALISPRPYRSSSFDNRTALEELTELAEKNCLNTKVLQTLIALNRHNRPKADDCVISLEKRGTPPADNNYGITIDETAPVKPLQNE
jgi:HD-GYP domain-containing protein (c-di-GMP phosphodiesterase class II)